MKNVKKLLSLLLALSMASSMVCTTALAEEATESCIACSGTGHVACTAAGCENGKITVTSKTDCEVCGGTGKVTSGATEETEATEEDAEPTETDCTAAGCEGGKITVTSKTDCEVCGGTGKVDCTNCDGTGKVAKPDPVVYTVTFDADNGTEYTTAQVTAGTTATRPDDPSKDGYTFTGWFQVMSEGAVSETAWDFGSPVTDNLTLKAKWTEVTSDDPRDDIELGNIKVKVECVNTDLVEHNTKYEGPSDLFEGTYTVTETNGAYTLNVQTQVYVGGPRAGYWHFNTGGAMHIALDETVTVPLVKNSQTGKWGVDNADNTVHIQVVCAPQVENELGLSFVCDSNGPKHTFGYNAYKTQHLFKDYWELDNLKREGGSITCTLAVNQEYLLSAAYNGLTTAPSTKDTWAFLNEYGEHTLNPDGSTATVTYHWDREQTKWVKDGDISAVTIHVKCNYVATSEESDLYVSNTGSDTAAGTKDAPFATLAHAVQAAKDGATIHVLSDLTMNTPVRCLGVAKNLTIKGENTTAPIVTRGRNIGAVQDNARSTYNPAMIEVDGTFRFENIVFDDDKQTAGTRYDQATTDGNGGNTDTVQDAIIATYDGGDTIILGNGVELRNFGGMSAVRLSGGTLTMQSGSKIVGSKEFSTRGDGTGPAGAVWIQGGTFTMDEGAEIKDMSGRAVYVDSGRATINGTISNITANANMWQGGEGVAAHIRNGGTLTLNGTVDGKKLATTAVVVTGTGTSFTMNKGSVIKDLTKAISMSDNSVVTVDGEITGLLGGGNAVNMTSGSKCTIGTNANIHHNSTWRSTIYCQSGELHVSGHFHHNFNYTDRSGAIEINNNGSGSTAFIEEGTLIEENYCKETGGGIMITNGTVTMSGGTITKNFAGTFGGGVSARKGGQFIMTGGKITNNVAGENGGGVSYEATDWNGKSAYVDLQGGEISGNKMGGTAELDKVALTMTVTGGTPNDLAVSTGDGPATTERYFKIGPAVVTNRNVYMSVDNKTVTVTDGTKLGNASSAADGEFGAKASEQGFADPLAALWIQNANGADVTVAGLTLAEKAVWMLVKNGGTIEPVVAVEKNGVVNFQAPASENGCELAVVQPDNADGTLTLTTDVHEIQEGQDSYAIPYTLSFAPTSAVGAVTSVSVEIISPLLTGEKTVTLTKDEVSGAWTGTWTGSLAGSSFKAGTSIITSAIATITAGMADTKPVYGNGVEILMVSKKDPVARNLQTGTEYFTLQEAVDEANSGETIQVLQNTAGASLQEAKSITVDIPKGLTVTPVSGKAYALAVAGSGAELTITGEGTISNPDTSKGYGVVAQNGGTLNVTGGTINGYRAIAGLTKANISVSGTATISGTIAGIHAQGAGVNVSINAGEVKGGKFGLYLSNGASGTVAGTAHLSRTKDDNSGFTISLKGPGGDSTTTPTTLTVNGGTITNTQNAAIAGNGTVSGTGDARHTKITINGGTITSTGSWGIYHPQQGEMTITGGTITGITGIEMRAGTLEVSGDAVIKATNATYEFDKNANGATTRGVGIAISQHVTERPITAVISGGTITGYHAVVEHDLENKPASSGVTLKIDGGLFTANPTDNVTVISDNSIKFITGGTFSNDVTGTESVKYLADGYESHPFSTPQGYYNVHRPDMAEGYLSNATHHWTNGCKFEGCLKGYDPAQVHQWGAWLMTRYPTVSTTGEEKRICSVCSREETHELSRLPVTPTYSYTITVKYVDEDGAAIAPDATVTTTGAYNVTDRQIEIDGYTFKEADRPLTGTVYASTTITLTYSKNAAPTPDEYTITVKYVDEEGSAIAPDVTVVTTDGGQYDVTDRQIEIDGYIFREADGALAGTVTEDTTITLIYTAEEEPVPEEYMVTVRYVDEEGNVIHSSVREATTNGGQYDVTDRQAEIDGYTFKEADKSLTGTVTEDTTITLTYARDEEESTHTVTWVDWNNAQLYRITGVAEGVDIPSSDYSGATPYRPSSGIYDYTFIGWSSAEVDSDGNVTYRAQYTPSLIYTEPTPGGDGGGGGGGGTPSTPPADDTPGGTVTVPDTTPPLGDSPDGGDTITIDDGSVPLASAPGLNSTDHFAYIIGYDDDTVRPTNSITRAEVATIFFRLMTDEYRTANWATANDFSDVSSGSWYNNAVSTCAKAGLVTGYEDGTFKPNQAITRAEFAAIAARFLGDDVTGEKVGDFSDTAGHWAAKEIRRAAEAGWVTGSGNAFRPNDQITRAEVMTIVNRMLDRIPDAEHMLETMKKWTDNPVDAWYYEAVQEATNEHAYERDELGATETWTEILTVRDWKALEAAWAEANAK